MAEGNAGVFDYEAIRKELAARGYRPVWHTAATDAKEPVCPAEGTCPIACRAQGGGIAEDAPANCRLRAQAAFA